MNPVIDSYLKSYNNKEEGFSRTKIVATWVCVVVMALQVKHATAINITELMLYDLGFVAACLGLKTYQSIRRISDENPTKTTAQTTLITKEQPSIVQSNIVTEKFNPDEIK